jgi:hypothetical protein
LPTLLLLLLVVVLVLLLFLLLTLMLLLLRLLVQGCSCLHPEQAQRLLQAAAHQQVLSSSPSHCCYRCCRQRVAQ